MDNLDEFELKHLSQNFNVKLPPISLQNLPRYPNCVHAGISLVIIPILFEIYSKKELEG